jgi:GT2 family glycosyltransferase
MELSVVIVTWNSTEYISDCLESIRRERGDLTVEVIVVDNGSADGTVEMVRQKFPWARLVMNRHNLGYTRACNLGIEGTSGRYVLLLNPDTVMQPGSLPRMIQYMDEHPRLGALGPQLLYPDGSIQFSCRQFPSYGLMFWEFTGFSMLFPKSHVFGAWRMGFFDHQQIRSVDQPMGACLLLRHTALREVGLLDERFEMFFNDVDLCRRLSSSGWGIVFFPGARVIHDAGSHVRRAYHRMIIASHKDCFRYFRKYHRGLLDELNLLILGCGLSISLPPRLLMSFLRGMLISPTSPRSSF